MRVLIPIALLLALGGCTVTEVALKAREVGDRVEKRFDANLDARERFYNRQIEAADRQCQLWMDEADRQRVMCSDGDCVQSAADAYQKAHDCYKNNAPSVSNIRGYRREIKKAFSPLNGEAR